MQNELYIRKFDKVDVIISYNHTVFFINMYVYVLTCSQCFLFLS